MDLVRSVRLGVFFCHCRPLPDTTLGSSYMDGKNPEKMKKAAISGIFIASYIFYPGHFDGTAVIIFVISLAVCAFTVVAAARLIKADAKKKKKQ